MATPARWLSWLNLNEVQINSTTSGYECATTDQGVILTPCSGKKTSFIAFAPNTIEIIE